MWGEGEIRCWPWYSEEAKITSACWRLAWEFKQFYMVLGSMDSHSLYSLHDFSPLSSFKHVFGSSTIDAHSGHWVPVLEFPFTIILQFLWSIVRAGLHLYPWWSIVLRSCVWVALVSACSSCNHNANAIPYLCSYWCWPRVSTTLWSSSGTTNTYSV